MDERFLDYYNRELRHIRETAGEFAEDYPKIAGRLGIEGLEVADPYVERLLEGFAFMAARVQLKLDSQYPAFTQQLLNIVYPHYQSQTPSVTIAQMHPSAGEGSLIGGFKLPRQTSLWSQTGNDRKLTPCEFRTCHETTLWPIEITEAKYITSDSALAASNWQFPETTKAGIRIKLKTQQGLKFKQLSLDNLDLYLSGEDELPMRLYEQIFANGLGFAIRATDNDESGGHFFKQSSIEQLGFEDENAIFPYPERSFQGYRLLHEYFTFHQRFMFVRLNQLQQFLQHCDSEEVEIMLLLDRSYPELSPLVTQDNFRLFCVPAVNLFPKNSERIQLQPGKQHYHVSPDRTRPLDFEIYSVEGVSGYSGGSQSVQDFQPFYGSEDHEHNHLDSGFYTTIRKPRKHSSKQKRLGARSNYYLGSEITLAIVDAENAPYSSDLKQLGLNLMCSNRDLPLHMPVGRGTTDFALESGAPIDAIKVVAGPSKPIASRPPSEISWKFINHLSLNYLSLEGDGDDNANKLREILRLYGNTQDSGVEKQIEAVKKISTQPITRQLPFPGKVAYGRGLRVNIECDENGFEGQGFYLVGAVMERFFAKYVSLNSFTETALYSSKRGEVKVWPARTGNNLVL